MRHALRFVLFGFICGAFAAVAAAQRLSAHIPPPQPAIGSHFPWSPGEYSYQPQYTPSGRDPHRSSWSAPAGDHPVSYAKGDENFVPSVYMEYEQALTLGKLELQEQALPPPERSLGEVARALRGNPDAAASNTMAFSAIQANDGQLVICRDTCRPVS
jgi:hypothetical protein